MSSVIHIIALLLLGSFAGIISTSLNFFVSGTNILFFSIMLGFPFGLLIGLYFAYYKKVQIVPNVLFFTLITICSFFIAVSLHAKLFDFFFIDPPISWGDLFYTHEQFLNLAITVIEGMINALLISMAFTKLICHLGKKQIIFLVILGGILCLLVWFNPLLGMVADMDIFWQSIMAGALGLTTSLTHAKRNEKLITK